MVHVVIIIFTNTYSLASGPRVPRDQWGTWGNSDNPLNPDPQGWEDRVCGLEGGAPGTDLPMEARAPPLVPCPWPDYLLSRSKGGVSLGGLVQAQP